MDVDIFILASWIGGVAFALSGFTQGVYKQLDIMGVFILSFITANGGGIIRDVLIGRIPMALENPEAIYLVAITFLFGLLLYWRGLIDVQQRSIFVLSDAIGLVAFSLTGALAGIDAGLNIFGVAVLTFITATGGGIIRDVFVNEVPSVFKSDFYGTIALIVAFAVYGLHHYELESNEALLGVLGSALLLRLMAYRLKWRLPRLKL